MSDAPSELQWFVHNLFCKDDLIEIRPIEIWTDSGGKRRTAALLSQRRWLRPREVLGQFRELKRLNITARANIFMGVNPRLRRGGKKTDVGSCRLLWADLDDVTPEIARWRCEEVSVPRPSVIIDSGNGVHLYWLLRDEVSISNSFVRQQIESRLKLLYRKLGCDSTSDVNRLLRLPGFDNVKNVRNGSDPVACQLAFASSTAKYSVDVVLPRLVGRPGRRSTRRAKRCLQKDDAADHVLRRLDLEVSDRSRRDFGVVCSLMRLGMSDDEILDRVSGHSKFATDGAGYCELTLANARKAIAIAS